MTVRRICSAKKNRKNEMQWPDDLVRLIYDHLHASSIQRHMRQYMYRHVNDENWPFLRRRLLQRLSVDDFARLQDCLLVRREWRTESSSWCHPDVDLNKIVYEVHAGLWSSRCVSDEAEQVFVTQVSVELGQPAVCVFCDMRKVLQIQ